MKAEHDRADFIRSVPLFASLPDSAIEDIAARATETHIVAGEWLFREGDFADGLYVLRTGRLEVVREAGDAEILIRGLSPGAVLGELAVLTDAPRSASVRARRDSGLLGLSGEDFHELLDDQRFALALTRALAIQLQASRAVTTPSDPIPKVIAVVGVSEGAAAGRFADELEQALARRAPVKQLDDGEAAEAPSYGSALDQWERASGQVVLPADSTSDAEWRAFCLRQADRVIAVADGATRPSSVDPALAGADLAMLGWPESRRGLAGWIEAIEPRTVYPLRDGDRRSESVDAAARRLSGFSTGVVLSGGGARGLAHIGVLDELIAAGVTIDRVGGCSMGALVGALFAIGHSPDEVEAKLRAELVERNPMNDYTIPLAALVRGRKAEAMLLRLFGDTSIEELEREFYCVSCDLVSSELIVHRRGALYEAVGASFCLPGIGPPVAAEERLLVDGGVLNNLPVETMATRGEGPVIAVDVSSRFEPPSRGAIARGRPGLRGLRERVRRAIVGWDTPLPSFPETLTRTVVLGSIDTAEAAQKHADIVIAPAVQGVGLTEFRRIGEIRAQGAAAARAALEQLPPAVFDAARSS
jgi:predicted acylesterase/phospholipase RssA/CRP-like cAMP-binding protein